MTQPGPGSAEPTIRPDDIPAYDAVAIEQQWRAVWNEQGVSTVGDAPSSNEASSYVLEMLPYPSGRLHMGHVKNYTMGDVITHFRRRNGARVLHPMGYDSFGLPAENAAIRTGGRPVDVTEKNILGIEQDFEHLGWSIDWSRKLATHRPDYYRWTQWLFLRFHERGLAYRKDAPVNWCPTDQTVLANEQVVDGACERCGSLVERRELNQWYFRITDYAQALLDDMKLLDRWPQRVLTMQRNWIGRSEGATVAFTCPRLNADLEVFTTRPDTLHGATFFVLAPEHPLLSKLVDGTPEQQTVQAYIEQAAGLSTIERSSTEREKTGVDTGQVVINPVNGNELPIWVADYVLPDYGSGALMAVPAHDARDHAFAIRFGLPVAQVIQPPSDAGSDDAALPWCEKQGTLVSSGEADGLTITDGAKKIVDDLGDRGAFTINYRLRDWLISRQRYWGCPIPIVHCDACGTVPVPDDQLPVVLPEVDDYTPKGQSPLAAAEDWVATTCPTCSGPARRETDTMDTFVDSSWYYLRYADPQNDTAPFSREIVDAWLPVDQYIGGIEHAVLHLLYARFFTKVLHDLGMVGFREPFTNLFTQGMIYYQGAKMSKSKGNVVEPLPYVERYGADALRTYILFLGPPAQDAEWQDSGIDGTRRFLDRLWRGVHRAQRRTPGAGIISCPAIDVLQGDAEARDLAAAAHAVIGKVTTDIDPRFHFNTAIAALMEATNILVRSINVDGDASDTTQSEPPARSAARRFLAQTIVSLVQPFAPHVACELWQLLGGSKLWAQPWPVADERYLVRDTVSIAVQVNGKLRGVVDVAPKAATDDVRAAVHADEKIMTWLSDVQVVKEIHVPDRLFNIVVKPS